MADSVLSRGGIYAIVHRDSGKRYVGSAVKFRNRFKEHRSKLSRGLHHSPKLQNAWRKYGADAFDFRILEVVSDIDLLLAVEQRWLDQAEAVRLGYNVCPTAGNTRGRMASDDTKAKMRAARAFISPETRQKRSDAMRGRTMSEEHKAKIAAAHKGRKFSPETIEKMRAAALARSPEVARKIALSRPKLVHSEQTKARMAAANKGRVHSVETRAKIGEASRGRTHSAETTAKRLATRAANAAS